MTNPRTLALAQKIIQYGGMPPSDWVLDLAGAVVDGARKIAELEADKRSIEDFLYAEFMTPDQTRKFNNYRNTILTKKDSSHE